MTRSTRNAGSILSSVVAVASLCTATSTIASAPEFVCGVDNPEDLVALPGSPWIIASGLGDRFFQNGRLHLIDTVTRHATTADLHLSADLVAQPPYEQCPGPPTGQFSAHGINLSRNAAGTSTLFVVNHGGRESIEVFRLTPTSAEPRIDWIGCILAPHDTNPNAVAARADGSVVMSTSVDGPLPIVKTADGFRLKEGVRLEDLRGAIYVWSPSGGWSKVLGSELAVNNGIELSNDGKWAYEVSTGDKSVTYMPLDPSYGKSRTIPLEFFPDNIRWTSDGQLAVAGSVGTTFERIDACNRTNDPHCGLDYRIVLIDPRTLAVTRFYDGKGTREFGMATTALKTESALWIGAARGTCVANVKLPWRQ